MSHEPMHRETPSWTTLVDAAALSDALARDDVVVIDARFSLADPSAGEAAWRQAHVPGARYAHLDRDLSDHRKRASGRHPWPEAEDFTVTLGQWGITPRHQMIAYDAGDGAHAARLWFLMRALGHERIAVLDGGWAQWTASGLPVDDAVPTPTPTAYPAQFDAGRLLDAAQVQAHLDNGGLLIDARAAERFRGEAEPIDRVAGHVPGAVNRAYADNLHGDCFKSTAALAEEFRQLLGGRAPDEVVAMCGSGVTACHHLLAMEHAGLPGAKLFTGSWSGWISDPARTVARGDA